MSALARYFLFKGYRVAGYDRTASHITDALSAEGAEICFDESPALIPDYCKSPENTLVVYTPAVPESHAGFSFFRENGFEIVKRAKLLGMITRNSRALCVAGTHGKTTTSSMLAHILDSAPDGCNAFLGGILKNCNSNLMLSDRCDLTVIEADEYDRSFLQLSPYMAVITAADPDHEITGYFVALCDSLDAIASAGGDGATIVNLARSAVDAASASVNVVVSAAAEARSSGREIIYDLQAIFDITDEEMPGLHEPVEDLNSSSEEGGNTGGDGGAGRDETVYAGDSEIYWASRGEYVKYGEALDGEYFANYTGYEGEISDELRNFIEAYFNSLRNGD